MDKASTDKEGNGLWLVQWFFAPVQEKPAGRHRCSLKCTPTGSHTHMKFFKQNEHTRHTTQDHRCCFPVDRGKVSTPGSPQGAGIIVARYNGINSKRQVPDDSARAARGQAFEQLNTTARDRQYTDSLVSRNTVVLPHTQLADSAPPCSVCRQAQHRHRARAPGKRQRARTALCSSHGRCFTLRRSSPRRAHLVSSGSRLTWMGV